MKTKIITDSTCDLPADILQQYDITVLPLHISKGAESYLDGVQIQPEDIYAYVDAGGEICSTASVNISEFFECFETFSPLYDAVIAITIGSGFSGCNQNAQVAAQKFENVYIMDSCNLSTGQGMLVLKAAELAQEEIAAAEICYQLEKIVPKIKSSFILDRLDYLKQGGRCSSVAALGANLLQLKPCIEVKDGHMAVGKKYRGSFSKAVCQYAKDQLTSCGKVCTDKAIIAIANPNGGVADMEVAKKAISENVRFETIVQTHAGCTVACHCGPTTLGITFMRE